MSIYVCTAENIYVWKDTQLKITNEWIYNSQQNSKTTNDL